MTGQTQALIGTDDLKVPYWALGYERMAGAGLFEVVLGAPRTVRHVVGLAWAVAPRLTVLVGVLQLARGGVQAFGLLATVNVFAGVLAAGPTPARLLAALPALATVVAAIALRGLLDAGIGATQARLAPQIERRADDQLYSALVDADVAAFDEPDFTNLVERVVQRSQGQFRQAVRYTSDLLTAAVSVVSALVAASVLHPLLPPIVLLAAVPQVWASARSAQLGFGSWLQLNSLARRLAVTGELIAQRRNVAEVRAFTAQHVLLAEHRRVAGEVLEEGMQVGGRQNRVRTLGRFLSGLGSGAGYAVLGVLIYTEVLPLALAGAAALALRTATSSTAIVVAGVSQLFETGITVELHQACVADARSRRRPPAETELVGDPELIELDDVAFRYPGRDVDAVSGITMRLRRGHVIALVGENGSGKSTLAKLLTGLYLPGRGAVRWNGVDIAGVDPRSLHDRVAMVLQDPLRWPMTADNNVRIGRLDRPDLDGAVLADALARSGADVVVSALPTGGQTVLSPRFQSGHDLSGGQWQRVSIARGLYRDAPVVVADEPTAAMDARAEHAVFGALQNMGGTERITVLVTHRLANIRHADQIIVLDGGRIVEHGDHVELMAARGLYHELFSLQAKPYAEQTVGVERPGRGARRR